MMRLAVIVLFAMSFQAIATAAEAFPAFGSSDHLTMNEWVVQNETGGFRGRVVGPSSHRNVSALGNVSVALVAGDGSVYRSSTSQSGQFEFPVVQPGIYSLTARCDRSFFVCAMHVIGKGMVGATQYPKSVEIMMAGVDHGILSSKFSQYMPSQSVVPNLSYDSANLQQLSSQVCSENCYQVMREGDGMSGQLYLPGISQGRVAVANRTNVFLFDGSAEVGRTMTDEQGKFEFHGIDSGIYSILAVGGNGLGLVGFELIDSEMLNRNTMRNADGETFVAQIGPGGGGFSMQLAPAGPSMQGIQIISDDESDGVLVDEFGNPLTDGGFFDPTLGGGGGGAGFSGGGGGGSSGGGGGIGGGGGLGGLAGLAALAAILANSNNNNNNFPIIAPVVSSSAAAN